MYVTVHVYVYMYVTVHAYVCTCACLFIRLCLYMYMYVPVGWRFGSRGYLASCLTSDVRVRPVPPILSVGWVYTLILVEVGGVIYV